jgi:hypothetical protein
MPALYDLKNLALIAAVLAWLLTGAPRRGWAGPLGALLLLAAAVEGTGRSLAARGIANLWLYNGYMVLDYGLMAAVLWELGGRTVRVRREVLAGAAVFGAAYAVEVATRPFDTRFLSNALVIGGFTLAVQAALGLYRLLDDGAAPLPARAAFWLLVAIALYSVAVTPVLGLHNFLRERNPVLAGRMQDLNDVLFALRYGLLAVALVLRWRNERAVRP